MKRVIIFSAMLTIVLAMSSCIGHVEPYRTRYSAGYYAMPAPSGVYPYITPHLYVYRPYYYPSYLWGFGYYGDWRHHPRHYGYNDHRRYDRDRGRDFHRDHNRPRSGGSHSHRKK